MNLCTTAEEKHGDPDDVCFDLWSFCFDWTKSGFVHCRKSQISVCGGKQKPFLQLFETAVCYPLSDTMLRKSR